MSKRSLLDRLLDPPKSRQNLGGFLVGAGIGLAAAPALGPSIIGKGSDAWLWGWIAACGVLAVIGYVINALASPADGRD
jgi:hypothetical protein